MMLTGSQSRPSKQEFRSFASRRDNPAGSVRVEHLSIFNSLRIKRRGMLTEAQLPWRGERLGHLFCDLTAADAAVRCARARRTTATTARSACEAAALAAGDVKQLVLTHIPAAGLVSLI
jgi:hypothetical protein